MIKFIISKIKKVLFTSDCLSVLCAVLTMLLSLFQIYPDPESEKAIMGSVVYCIHHKEGCQWSDELRKLKVRYLRIVNIYMRK